MNKLHKIEIEKLNNAGTHVRKNDVEQPEADVGDIERDGNSTESEQQQQARESEKAFDEALTRLPPG